MLFMGSRRKPSTASQAWLLHEKGDVLGYQQVPASAVIAAGAGENHPLQYLLKEHLVFSPTLQPRSYFLLLISSASLPKRPQSHHCLLAVSWAVQGLPKVSHLGASLAISGLFLFLVVGGWAGIAPFPPILGARPMHLR